MHRRKSNEKRGHGIGKEIRFAGIYPRKIPADHPLYFFIEMLGVN